MTHRNELVKGYHPMQAEVAGNEAWLKVAHDFYLDLIASGKSQERAVELAIIEADTAENEGEL